MRDKSNQKRAFLSGTEDDFPDGGGKVRLGFPARFSGWRGIGGCVWEGFGKMENERVRGGIWWETALSVASLRGDVPPA